MAKMFPIQTQFTAGELSPRLRARSDIDGYAAGVDRLENFVSLRHGPVSRRSGSRCVHTTDEVTYGKLLKAQINENLGVVLLFIAGRLRVFDRDGLATGGNILLNGEFSDSSSWVANASQGGTVVFTGGKCYLNTNGGTPTSPSKASITQTVSGLTADTDYTFFFRGTPDNSGAQLKIEIISASGSPGVILGSNLPSSSYGSVSFNSASHSSVIVRVSLTTSSGSHLWALDYVRLFAAESSLYQEFVTNYTTDAEVGAIQYAMPPGDDVVYFVTPNKPPSKLSYNGGTGWTYGVVSFTSKPAEWVSGNYPGSVTFYQGRSWWGGTSKEPETFWASQSGSLEDMTTGAEDDDGLQFTMNTRGRIRWMLGSRSLLIGTSTGENIVDSDGGVITPSDIQIRQQSANGSAAVQPLPIDNRAIYVSSDGAKLRDMGYVWTDDGWVSRDLSFTAEHFKDIGPISGIDYSKNPESLIWAVAGGDVLGCTYDANNNILGWHHHTTQGYVLSIAVTESAGSSYAWILVSRENANGRYLAVELFDIAERLDSSLEFFDGNGITEISVPHLAGNTVSVLVDGAVHPDVDLDESGHGVLQFSGKTVVAGLSFVSTLITLPVSIVGQGGTNRQMPKRFSKVYVALNSSALPRINGILPPDRTPSTPMNTSEPRRTQVVGVNTEGWDDEAQIIVTQQLPLPTQVLSIMGELTSNSL